MWKNRNNFYFFILILFSVFDLSCKEIQEVSDRHIKAPIILEDRDNGLAFHLILNKIVFRTGETIEAKVRLRNTLSKSVCVHYLDLSPVYFENTKEKFNCPENYWRKAYTIPGILNVTIEWPLNNLLIDYTLDTSQKTKKKYEMNLASATYGSFYPSFTIPANSVIEWKREFKADPRKNYIDVGLFSLKNFYSTEVLNKSGKNNFWGQDGELKKYIEIWFGSLYIGQEISVEEEQK